VGISKAKYMNFKDNLLSANHRNAMKQRYGATEAEWITIEDFERADMRETIAQKKLGWL
jgi:hypothetical protein